MPESARDMEAVQPRRFPRLDRQAGLPTRSRALLQGVLERCAQHFGPALTQTVGALRAGLDGDHNRLLSHGEQGELVAMLRAVEQLRHGPLLDSFMDELVAALLAVPAAAAADAAAAPTGRQPLQLVAESVLEEDLADERIVRKMQLRHGAAVAPLASRLAVIQARPAYAEADLPLGAAALLAAWKKASGSASWPASRRVAGVREFERTGMAGLGQLYKALNDWLIGQGVLPNLDSSLPAMPRRPASGPKAQAPEKPHVPASSAPVPAGTGAGTAGMPQPSRQASSQASARATDGPEPGMAEALEDGEHLFGALREALRAARAPHRPTPSAEAWLARGDDLQSVLRLVQQERQPSADELLSPRNAKQLRQLVMARLGSLAPDDQSPVLAEQDEDTLDLVGMLFEHLVEGPIPAPLRRALAGLQLPVLRAALRDQAFFTQPSHIVRQLLTDVVQTGVDWLEEPDPELESRLRALTEHVETVEDEAQIQSSLDDFKEHVQRLARRAEAAEKRHVEAAQGRAKLDQARQFAEQAMEKLLWRHEASPRLRELLSSAWTDVLVLAVLREGDASALFRRRLAVADWLLRNARRREARLIPGVEQELRAGLAQVGQHEQQISALLETLLAPADGAPPASAPEEPQPPRPRLGEVAARQSEDGQSPIDEAAAGILRTLREVPFGTWFEFAAAPGEPPLRRKLAWLSPVSGHCLMVTRRGQRSDDITMRDLARGLADGTIRQLSDRQGSRGSLIGRAWQAILHGLQQQGAT